MQLKLNINLKNIQCLAKPEFPVLICILAGDTDFLID